MYLAGRHDDSLIFVFEINSAWVWRGNLGVIDANQCLVERKSFEFQMCG